MRKYIFGIALLAALILAGGCVVIDDVIMPDSSYQYSSFHVTINIYVSEYGTGAYRLLGILIPIGWEPSDVQYSGPQGDGSGVYDYVVTGWLESISPAPEGYVWWGFATEVPVGGDAGDEYDVDFDVLTDGQFGTFYLDFVVGYIAEAYCYENDRSEDNEIEIIEDQEDPYITDTYPHNEDWPSGVPPTENAAGCRWNGGDPDENTRIDIDESTFEVRDSGDNPVSGDLDIDDSDPYDVIVDFQADDLWVGGETYTVETTTYDLAGNLATEIWDFTAGYVTIETKSFGAVKALYAE
jgi:hypothetical protein